MKYEKKYVSLLKYLLTCDHLIKVCIKGLKRLPLGSHFLSLHRRVEPRLWPCQVLSIRFYTNTRSLDAS